MCRRRFGRCCSSISSASNLGFMRFLRNGDSEPNSLAAGIIYHYGATEGYPS